MAPADDRMAFLVKGKGPAARGRFALGPAGANIHFSAEPLFRSIGAAGRLGAAPSGSQWFRVTADAGADSANPWDACHALMAQAGRVLPAAASNLSSPTFCSDGPSCPAPRAPLPCDEGGQAPRAEQGRFPRHSRGQFLVSRCQARAIRRALAGLADPGDGKRTRIAHLDTGYDPGHRSRPIHLSQAEQRNFVDADAPNDARDRSAGLFNNFSHGTGTLSILRRAGRRGQGLAARRMPR